MQDEVFTIQSACDKITIRIDKVPGFPGNTFFMGGYDAVCTLEIISTVFSAVGTVYISTAVFYDLYEGLKEGYRLLTGSAKIYSYENDFCATITFIDNGHVSVEGYFSNEPGNELKFYFETDQTFMTTTLQDLSKIVEKYGDNYGKSTHK